MIIIKIIMIIALVMQQFFTTTELYEGGSES